MDDDYDVIGIVKAINNLEKRMDAKSDVMIQSGIIQCRDGYEVENPISKPGKKGHSYYPTERVVFEKPFKAMPTMHFGLSFLDSDTSEHSLRISVLAEDVDEKGFKPVISTWNDTRIFGFRMEWLAYAISNG